MWSIIQEYVRKINTSLDKSLSWLEITSICLAFLVISFGAIVLGIRDIVMRNAVIYREQTNDILAYNSQESNKNRAIIASKNGKAYFFSWCQGVGKIKETNKISFLNEEEAKASGRALSKTCK